MMYPRKILILSILFSFTYKNCITASESVASIQQTKDIFYAKKQSIELGIKTVKDLFNESSLNKIKLSDNAKSFILALTIIGGTAAIIIASTAIYHANKNNKKTSNTNSEKLSESWVVFPTKLKQLNGIEDLDEDEKDRAKGAIVGTYIGDAKGLTYEYFEGMNLDKEINESKKALELFTMAYNGRTNPEYIKEVTKNIDEMIGGGYFNVEAGEFSDDFALTLVLMQTLMESNFQPSEFNKNYQANLDRWWKEKKFITPSTRFAIGRMTKERIESNTTTSKNLTNGHIMCAAPLACTKKLSTNLELAKEKTKYFQKDAEDSWMLTMLFVQILHNLIHINKNTSTTFAEIVKKSINHFESNSPAKKYINAFIEEIFDEEKYKTFEELKNLRWENGEGQNFLQNMSKNFTVKSHQGIVVVNPDNQFKIQVVDKEYHSNTGAIQSVFKIQDKDVEFEYITYENITTLYDLGWVLGSSGSGISCLLTALAAVNFSSSFKEAIQNALLCFGDSDTIAAITGQLAGAWYGFKQIKADEDSFRNWFGENSPIKSNAPNIEGYIDHFLNIDDNKLF